MNLQIALYEDENSRLLSPLSLTRPVYDLRCGMFLLREKIQHQLPAHDLHFLCRPYLAETFRESITSTNEKSRVNQISGDNYLLLNGRFIPASGELEKITAVGNSGLKWSIGNTVVAARISGSMLDGMLNAHDGVLPSSALADLPDAPGPLTGELITYPWHLVNANAKQIEADFNLRGQGGKIFGKVYPNATLLNEENIYIAPGAVIKPGAVLDAESGPIYVDKKAVVMPNATLEGPVFIGEGSTIKIGAKIYEGTSIGEVCKVGGEVEESIIHSFSNKQHEGFLGHAYLGQWVNIGADSNNSDLKNNYGNVKVFADGEWIDSGSQFVGLTMGDHAKCAINTMFNTGTIVGIMCNVFGAGFPPKYLPSFSWGGAEDIVPYQIDKALAVARRVMARRNKQLTPAMEAMLRHIAGAND